MNDLSTIGN